MILKPTSAIRHRWTMSSRRYSLDVRRRLPVLLALLLVATFAVAQEPSSPLKPPDRSSPRAALETFLASGDELAAFLVKDYVPAPSREKFDRAASLGEVFVRALDLSEVPPAARKKTARAAAVTLYEVLSRLPLPSLEEVPDAEQMAARPGADAKRWVIPNTEIALVRAESGPRAGDFLFSADTVVRADEFHDKVRGLPYTRVVPFENLRDFVTDWGGWMIPQAAIQALPSWLHARFAGQPVWKWAGLGLLLAAYALVLWLGYRLSRLGNGRYPLTDALAAFAMPAFLLAATPVVVDFALVQIYLTGGVAAAIELAATALMFGAGAWMLWRFAAVLAEAIIASPRVPLESIDAHLIRISTRLLGLFGSAALLAIGADRLGLPLYGIVAGLGVGGLAIALAAQPTIENLIGGINLFADKPVRVGELCQYGDQVGTVEAIGVRSARIRGVDRKLTTIPNAALAKMPIVNFTRRDKMLIDAVIGLRYETTPDQLRYVLVKLREMLLGHPRVDPDPARARFLGFGASSLDIQLFAYVTTRDWGEFLGIREDILLRVMDIVGQSGTSIAFPSRTLYLGRDRGPDDGRTQDAEAQVRTWRQEGSLPFPNFSPEQAARLGGSVDFPPAGSAQTSDAEAPRVR